MDGTNLGSVKLTVLAPPTGVLRGEQNLNSVGLLVQYGTFRALLTGDSEKEQTAAWLRKYPASTLDPVDLDKRFTMGPRMGTQPRGWLRCGRRTWSNPTTTATRRARR